MPAFPDLDAPLRTDAVVLRLATERDIPEILIAHQDDPRLAEHLGLRRPPSGAELGRRTEHSAEERAAGAALWLTILDPGSDECRGQLDVRDVDWDHRVAALTVWVAPRDRGRGLASGALSLAGPWLLRECGLERLQLLVAPGNEPMLRTAAAAGFADEGTIRGYLLQHDRRVDITMLSLIRADVEPA